MLKQLAREWTTDGQPERERVHKAVLAAIRKCCPTTLCNQTVNFPGQRRWKLRGAPSGMAGERTGREQGATGSDRAYRPLVLVPGAGTGRLALEIMRQGYRVQSASLVASL